MPLTADNAREFWQERYETEHTPWDRGETNPALHAWLDEGEIAPPATVLVPGCGRGYEVMELARRGFEVTGVDLSGLALAALKGRLEEASLSASLLEADLLGWTPVRRFDAIYEQTCLCALLPRYWPGYEARLHAWLKPGGRLMALFMQSEKFDGPPFHCALPDMRDLFDVSRWHWPDRDPEPIPHPADVFEYAVQLVSRAVSRGRST